MEQAIIKLMKITLDNTVKADYSTTNADDEKVIDNILQQSELTLHPWARQELINHVAVLHRPF